MAYATQADLVPLRLTQKELIQLTDDDGSGAVNAAVVSGALEEASGKIDAYCRNRYLTPLQPSDSLTGLTVDLATYLLFSRRRNVKMTETVRQRYDDAIAFLKDISTGKASFDQPSGAPAPQTAAGGPITSPKQHKVFDEHHIKGFV